MAIDKARLRSHARAGAQVTDAQIQDCLESAAEMLKELIGRKVVPPKSYDRAHLLVANEMLQQDLAPNGILNQQYDDGDGSVPIRIGRDPLTPAYPILAPFGVARMVAW